jgi:hypothetical protein
MRRVIRCTCRMATFPRRCTRDASNAAADMVWDLPPPGTSCAVRAVGEAPARADVLIHLWLAIAAAIVLGLLVVFQLLLAAGLPLGRAAGRGKYRVLPSSLRWASLAAAGVLGLAAWVVLVRAAVVAAGPEQIAIRAGTWVFAGFFFLNAAGNVTSQSRVERYGMTLVVQFLGVSFTVVALSTAG